MPASEPKLGSGRKVSLNRLCGQDGSHITNRGESKTHPLERSVGGYPRALSISLIGSSILHSSKKRLREQLPIWKLLRQVLEFSRIREYCFKTRQKNMIFSKKQKWLDKFSAIRKSWEQFRPAWRNLNAFDLF